MSSLWWILGATLLISLTAWVGVLALFLREALLDRILLVLVALAAGALIGGAFFFLLPRAIAETGTDDTLPLFASLVVGFCAFFVLEQFIHWHHHHAAVHRREPVSYLVLLSDSIHTFIDGLVIAGAFLVGVGVRPPRAQRVGRVKLGLLHPLGVGTPRLSPPSRPDRKNRPGPAQATTTTGIGARRVTVSATLPRKARPSPDRPWLPRTIWSTSAASA